MTFKELNIIDAIIKSLEEQGYDIPTPIQEEAIPALLDGKDILGTAQTGTGKTAAFAIPILQNLNKDFPIKAGNRRIKALILSPTRELATQIKDSFVSYGKYLGYKSTVIFGGVTQGNQVKALRSGVDILIATPGRLLDLMSQRLVDLRDVKYLVLDEADRMLDMGFINDVNKIVSYISNDRQTMLFSATLPKEITKIASELLTNPIRVSVAPVEAPIDTIKQTVYKVIKKDKINLLVDILSEKDAPAALVFSRTKHGANKIVTDLLKAGLTAAAIHGNKSQAARELALKNFKDKKIQVLVATDIASRGIDINDLALVINYDLPEVPETYIHRIGRTGRAGRGGVALTFCNPEEIDLLKAIEKHTNISLPVDVNHRYDCSKDIDRLVMNKAVNKPEFSRSRTSSRTSSKPTEFRDRKKSNDYKSEYSEKLESKVNKKSEYTEKSEFKGYKKQDGKKSVGPKSKDSSFSKTKEVYLENRKPKQTSTHKRRNANY